MVDFAAVTDEDLERARQDPAFRQKLLSNHLEVLLLTLNKMRTTNTAWDKTSARQIRDGVDLAVKLADMLQAAKRENESPKAA
ncbi:MAG TPA: hypothetical protein VHK44_10590 [Xanthobacteraceae bacterium]|jgi:hypothetical protein|nr:hypothetical protein [Xanthobacteraceae bacterium]